VWYSLISDNFHDFFTEYIPFGEDAVLYFEEREFRKRFPRATNPTNRPSTLRDTGEKVTIPSKSGLSWRVAEDEGSGSDLGKKGRHMSALDANPAKAEVQQAQRAPNEATAGEKTKAVEIAKKEAPSPAAIVSSTVKKDTVEGTPKESIPVTPGAVAETKPLPMVGTAPKERVSEASQASTSANTGSSSPRGPEAAKVGVFTPITRIDPLKIDHANEPIVQDLVHTLNDIITVINADNSNGKFNSIMSKAKAELATVGKKIMDLKAGEQAAAEQKIKSLHQDFDKAAKELVQRLENEMQDQEARWKEEFESEREKISQMYQERITSEVERAKELAEQKLRNQLLEQAVAMKKQFTSEVKNRVETERDGRLSRLSELAGSVSDLEKLTSEWNSVIDANLKTQHLQVAVEAVRAGLEQADRPRPFVKELAALKEIAADDPVVNSAIASINPVAYQLGVPTSGQLIDRFRHVAKEVRKASLLPEDAGVASHAASLLLSKLLFKKQGRAVGDDVESVLTRAETLLEEGDLDEAAREMNTLTGWAKTLSKDWLAEVRRVLEVRQALDVSFINNLISPAL
jgi:mitofilin